MYNLVKLHTLCTKITDGSHYSPKEDIKGIYPMLSVKDMKENGFVYDNCKLINSIEYNKLVKSDCKPKTNDILIAKDGSYLKHVFVIEEEIEQAILSSIGILRPDCKKVIPQYLKYYLQTKSVKKEVAKKYVSGSALPRIILKGFSEIDVLYKSLDEQIKISNLLSKIDKKIELNNKINKNLESMAKTLYDYWFVQFDFPNENGKPYKSSGEKMIYNKELKRKIPSDWNDSILEKIENNIITGKTPPRKNESYFNGDIPFITIGDIRGNMHIVDTEETLTSEGAEYQATKYLNKGAICVSCIASPGLVGFVTELSQTNQQINSIECEKEENQFYLYFTLLDYFKNAKAKTGNTFPNMNKGDFSNIKLIKPQDDILIKFRDIIKPSIDKILINSKENQKLSELRDWLLPMLMNGQVKVKDSCYPNNAVDSLIAAELKSKYGN